MRDKLSELILDSPVAMMPETAEHIADHLFANGVIVLPCKVGDTVWLSKWWTMIGKQLKEPISRKVLHFAIDSEGINVMCKDGCFSASSGLGVYAFLSREDAEAALKEVYNHGHV